MKLSDLIKTSNYKPKDGKQERLDCEKRLAKFLEDPESAYEIYKQEFYPEITEMLKRISLLSDEVKFLESKLDKAKILKNIIAVQIEDKKDSIVHWGKRLEELKRDAIEDDEKPMSFEEWKKNEMNDLQNEIKYIHEAFEKKYDDRNKIYQEMIQELKALDNETKA